RLLWQLKKALNKRRPALVHAHGMKAILYAWLTAPSGSKLIVTHHGKTSHTWKVRLYEFIELFIMKRAHGVIAVSNPMRDSLQKAGVKSRKLFLVENFLTLTNLSVP